MKIRAKVRCSKAEKYAGGESVAFEAVYSDDKAQENYSFSQATPSLSLQMQISNPSALGQFEQGKEYYLDFTPA